MIELLQRTYQQNLEFTFHRFCHKNKEEYIKTMKRQNSYLKKSRIVVLTGIHPTIMWTLADKFCHEFKGVTRITKHKDTMRIGRFNVHTTKKYFDLVKDALKFRITAMVQLERSVHNLNPREPYQGRYPQVFLKHELYGSGGTGEDDAASTDHGGSFATFVTYILSIKSAYSKNEDNDNSSDGTHGGESYFEPPSNNPSSMDFFSSCPNSSGFNDGCDNKPVHQRRFWTDEKRERRVDHWSKRTQGRFESVHLKSKGHASKWTVTDD